MCWCVGGQRGSLSKKPSSDRRHDSQQREREAAQAKEREKTAERERERERENGAEMLIRKNKPRMLI